jgi:hypothetical protein
MSTHTTVVPDRASIFATMHRTVKMLALGNNLAFRYNTCATVEERPFRAASSTRKRKGL